MTTITYWTRELFNGAPSQARLLSRCRCLLFCEGWPYRSRLLPSDINCHLDKPELAFSPIGENDSHLSTASAVCHPSPTCRREMSSYDPARSHCAITYPKLPLLPPWLGDSGLQGSVVPSPCPHSRIWLSLVIHFFLCDILTKMSPCLVG